MAEGLLRARLGAFGGPLLAFGVWWLIGDDPSVLGEPGRRTAAMAVWMAVWWMTEPVPIYATGLVPLAAFPLLGIADMPSTAEPYGHPLIYLFLGGFLLALAMERSGLHARIAQRAVRLVGTRPDRVMGAFLLTSAFLSMWVSNTATAVVMTPIALSLLSGAASGQRPFATGLLLSVAYGASIGGVATLIGTPPNLFLASFAEQSLGVGISFAGWLVTALPLSLFLGLSAWVLITRILFRCDRTEVSVPAAELPHLSPAEKRVAMVFAAAAGLWVSRPVLVELEIFGTPLLAGLTDPGIAVIAGLVLFLLPDGRGGALLTWRDTRRLPWGILVLFGGGLSLAAAMDGNGVSRYLGEALSWAAELPPVLIVLAVCALMIFLTEVTSNTATTAAMVPVFAAMAEGAGLPPMLLALPAAVAASCAFMLPVATPPNAIVFGSGHLSISAMVRAGFWLNLLSIVAVTAWTLSLGRGLTGG